MFISFDLDIPKIMQYAYNVFASALPAAYLYFGAAFGLFVLGGIIAVAKGR